MKHAIIFAGVMGVILSMGAANADFPADTASYPVYQSGQQTVGTGANAQTFAEGSLKDPNIKLATTKYLDKQANTVNSDVQTLNNTANTDNATVMANKTDIEEMESDRQVVAGNPCDRLANDEIACGYIVPEGTTTTNNNAQKHVKANYNWVKIVATVDAVAAANGSSSGSSGA
ncbi:MAG: hypothetical protein ACLRFM_01270 [Alphaproteobacteria bacterium]